MEDLTQQVDHLKTRLADLETQYRMKVHKEQEEIDREVLNEMYRTVPHWQKSALLIQSVWKGQKMRKVFKNLKKTKLESQAAQKITPECLVLQRFSLVLKKRKLTLEECFRAADLDSDKTVSCEEFSKFLSKLNLEVKSSEITRLISVLDEDLSGKLESQEFYETLAAYRVSSDPNMVKGYYRQVVNKLLGVMEERKLDPEGFFNSCDLDKNELVCLQELEKQCRNLGLFKREIVVLMEILDSDQDGSVSKAEFLRQVKKDQNIFQVEKARGTMDMPKNLEEVIRSIEATGMALTKAFDLIHFPESGKVQISYIAGSFAKLFPAVSKNDINFLLSSIDSSKTGFIYYKDLVFFLHSYAGTTELTEKQAKEHMLTVLGKLNVSIEDLVASKDYPSIMDVSCFIKFMKDAFEITEEQSIALFNQISNYTGRVTLQDLSKFANTQSDFSEESLTPRSKSQKLVSDIVSIVSSYDLKLVNLFKFADPKNTGQCPAKLFCECLKKIAPVSEKQVFELVKLLPPVLTMQDLKVIMPENAELGVDELGYTKEEVYWIVLFKIAIEKKGINPSTLFDEFDADKNKLISTEEFKDLLKKSVPGAVLTQTDISLIFKSFDKDSNGSIDLQELSQTLISIQKSSFFSEMLQKAEEQQTQYDRLQSSVRPKLKKSDFPVPPMPLMHLSRRQDCYQIFESFSRELPSHVLTHEFLSSSNLRLSSLISAKHLKVLFKLSESQAESLFKSIDLHNKGVTYCFVLCSVIDSFRMNLTCFPIPHNPAADPLALKALEKMKKNLQSEPVFSRLPPLSSKLIWEDFKSLPLDPHEVFIIKAAFPRVTFGYHLAAALLNNSAGLIICPSEVLYGVIQKLELRAQAADVFERFNLHPSDVLSRGVFIEQISRALLISSVESDSLFLKYNKSKDSSSLFNFFTFFDMVQSAYEQSQPPEKLPAEKLPALPFNEKNLPSRVFQFFSDLSRFIDRPFLRYGLNLSSNYNVSSFSQAFQDFSRSKEIEIYFPLLSMNENKNIRCYHLAAVLDSFGGSLKSLNSSFDLSLIKSSIGLTRTSGLKFIQNKRVKVEETLAQEDLRDHLPLLSNDYASLLFSFADPFERRFIYGHQLATLIDICMKAQLLADFPLCGNPGIGNDVKRLLSSTSRHLDVYDKSAVSFYLTSDSEIEELLDLRRFQVKFGFEYTETEAEKIFRALDYLKIDKVPVYHYISCIESFCRKTLVQTQYFRESPLQAIYKIALEIPSDVSTAEYFTELTWHRIASRDEIALFLTKKFGLASNTVFGIIKEISKKDQIWVYELISLIDVYRNTIENSTVVREPLYLPVKSRAKDMQTDSNFHILASRLDSANRGSCDYFWGKGIDPTQEVSVQEFFTSLPELNSQQCGQIFKELNIKRTGFVFLYHFLAVLETYREKLCENRCKPVIKKKIVKKTDAVPASTNPLREALNKLGEYLSGNNTKKRPLSSSEVFGMMDYNSDGKVTANEFLDCLSLLPLNLSQDQIYFLLKEADLNGDGIIDYKEFSHFILNSMTKPNLKAVQSTVIPKPGIREVKGLRTDILIPEGSLEEAIMNLKMYIDSNQSGNSAIEIVFQKIDYESTGKMLKDEFLLAIDRLNLPISAKQRTSLLKFADKDRNEQIDYKSFIDFLYLYSFQQIKEEIPGLVSVKDYPLQSSDFFDKYQKNSTILNSEKAALKRAAELLKNGKFLDPDFGPEIGKNGSACLYFNSKPPTASYPKPGSLTWVHLEEAFPGCCFFKGIRSNKLVQGSLANCWFLGALSVLATREELIRGSVEDLKNPQQINASSVSGLGVGIHPPIFHTLAQKGLFVFRFFKEFAWRYVIIDSRVPMFKQETSYKYVFGHCNDESEIWVPLIEKAYAKLHGCYEALNNGQIDDALVDMTGTQSEKVTTRDLDSEVLWKTLNLLKNSRSLLGCSIEYESGDTEVVIDGEPCGLLTKHCYNLVDLLLLKNKNTPKQRHRLLKIRNPWGQREWVGKWSAGNEKLNSCTGLISDYLKTATQGQVFDPNNPSDGSFFMSFKDWRNIFTHFFPCFGFPEHWSGLRLSGKWDETSSGGVPGKNMKKEQGTWSKNPKFLMQLKEDCELFIELSQKEGRFTKDAFPYKASLFYICFAILKLLPDENEINELDQNRVVKLSSLKLHRQVQMRTTLPTGRYCIVPATRDPGQISEFWLSVYFSCERAGIYLSGSPELVRGEEVFESDEDAIRRKRDLFEEVNSF